MSIPEGFPGSKHLNAVQVAEKEIHTAHEESNGIDTEYKIKEQWHSQRRHLRVIHVGAGAAGLLMAYKMRKDFEDYSLVCYEKYKHPRCSGNITLD
jgi:ribulose 1,5-bisphosphate synthetase/thiazole synthase